MDKIVTLLGERFLNFFTRSVAPSSIFFVLLFFNDNLFNHGAVYLQFTEFLQNVLKINEIYLYVCLVLLFLAYGYINQIATQFLDNFIKGDYCDNLEFKELRELVKGTLTEQEKKVLKVIGYSDYNLYQVLGNIKDIKPDRNYVDEVKALHTVCVAIGFNMAIIFLFKDINLLAAMYIPMIAFFYYMLCLYFNKLAKSRYKSRNQRLYINYLLKNE